MCKIFITFIFILFGIAIGLLVVSSSITTNADEHIKHIDEFIKEHESETTVVYKVEPETVSLSYEEWKNGDSSVHNGEWANQSTIDDDTDIDDYQGYQDALVEVDVWTLGAENYGISELDTTRTLKLITYEGYGYSPLSYYVACCCWVRATEGYWGYDNLYSAFGEADTSYDEWMDELDIADWAYDALDECYRNPMYVRYCNGMAEPYDYIYYESGIYVWN